MNNNPDCHPDTPENGQQNKFLTIEEKRAWLAVIFRDTTGTYSDSDKFKAMLEDTRLATLNHLSTGQPKDDN